MVAGPGSQALIQALSHILPRGAVGALGPTYGGFASAFAAAGGRVVEAKRLEDMDGPRRRDRGQSQQSGRAGHFARSRSSIFTRASHGARALLIVDEAFADFDGEAESFAPIAARERRGRPALVRQGLRAGGAAARFRARVAGHRPALAGALGPWPVSGPAIAIGAQALADSDWLEAMRARLGGDAARLDALLHGAGWRIIGGTRLFRLAAHADARAAFERLLVAGILTRPFADAPDWLRFGIPGDENAWERLAAALRTE